jgi:DNA-binding NtrC family response regulator
MADRTIEPMHLPASIIKHIGDKPKPIPLHFSQADETLQTSGLDEHLRQTEMSLIKDALHQSKGVQKQAARILGIKERSLWHRLRKYGIDAARFKNDN